MENFISILGERIWRPKNLDLFSTIKFMEQLHVRIFVVTPVLSTPSPSLNSGILAICKSIKQPNEYKLVTSCYCYQWINWRTHLKGDFGCWRFCSNVEHKQCKSKTHHNSPSNLQPNPSTWIRVMVREVPLPPSIFFIIILIKQRFLFLITDHTATVVDDHQMVIITVFSGSAVIWDLLVVQERVVGASRGGVAAKGKSVGFLFVGRICSVGLRSVRGVESWIGVVLDVAMLVYAICMGDCGGALDIVSTRVGLVCQSFMIFNNIVVMMHTIMVRHYCRVFLSMPNK